MRPSQLLGLERDINWGHCLKLKRKLLGVMSGAARTDISITDLDVKSWAGLDLCSHRTLLLRRLLDIPWW